MLLQSLILPENNYKYGMKIKAFIGLTTAVIISHLAIAQSDINTNKVMDGFPPSRESQVTFQNYRDYPYSQWSFRNIGAPLHVLMVPRAGSVHTFKSSTKISVATTPIKDSAGNTQTFETTFKNNYADGIIVIQNGKLLYENYWNGLSKDYQHIWFSMTKSLTSSAFGLLVEEKKVNLSASPVQYIPELKGSAYERATIQDILNMSTALGFTENYIDTSSFFYKFYGSSSGFFYVNGQDANPQTTTILGNYDFLAKKATQNNNLQPGYKFEYNSSNADVISWIISRLTGKPYNEFIQENIWSKIGAEHDAYITADRSLLAAATGGMNSTLRDAALFGTLILKRGSIDGKQILPAKWIDETLKLTPADKVRYSRNDVYVKAKMPWVAYKNFWWILDENKGEYAAVGMHGQVIYINRSANLVIAYFSSQPEAGSFASKNFLPKLNACRELSKKLMK
jgi:CubicO group peptidase (beta-lactamase class C family)